MEAFTLHAETSRTEPDRDWPSVFTGWCLVLLASQRPILLRSRSNFQRLKCLFFTMSANTLACMKIQEMIFQEIQKQKGTQRSTISSQMQLFHYEDRRSNQGERDQHLTAQSLFLTFSEWQLSYVRSYLFFHYPTSHTLLWVLYHYFI